jgi:hypothetical protein
MATEPEVKTEWRPISTAPNLTTILVADDSAETIALAQCRSGTWFLAPSVEELEFPPQWWLPANYDGNPFRVRVPRL